MKLELVCHEEQIMKVISSSGLVLKYNREEFQPVTGKHFMFFDTNSDTRKGVPTTGRDIESRVAYCSYPGKLRELVRSLPKNTQYIEVGAGLGEFIPYVVKRGIARKPIVIDPFDYKTAIQMLESLQPHITRPWHQEQLRTLLSRARLLSDGSSVNHIQKTLGRAFKEHPEIHGVGDVVVDFFGPHYWRRTEEGNVPKMEARLLEETGILYTYHREFQNYAQAQISARGSLS